jgi:hypothetical protein
MYVLIRTHKIAQLFRNWYAYCGMSKSLVTVKSHADRLLNHVSVARLYKHPGSHREQNYD